MTNTEFAHNPTAVKTEPSNDTDARHHTVKIKQMLNEVAVHAREDANRVSDPHAKALFETTAEVLNGLQRAYSDYENKSEPAWK